MTLAVAELRFVLEEISLLLNDIVHEWMHTRKSKYYKSIFHFQCGYSSRAWILGFQTYEDLATNKPKYTRLLFNIIELTKLMKESREVKLWDSYLKARPRASAERKSDVVVIQSKLRDARVKLKNVLREHIQPLLDPAIYHFNEPEIKEIAKVYFY